MTTNFAKLLVTTTLFVLLPVGQTSAAASYDQAVASRIDPLLEKLDRLAMFGGGVLVDKGGQVIYRREIGPASVAHDVQVNRNTRFRLASLSKLYCDALVAKLVEQGKLSLSDTLDRWLPEFSAANRISIEHLLKHQSGIPHTNNQTWGDGSTVIPRKELIRRLSLLPLNFEPGSDRAYSNGGYAVLVDVVEKATGLTYEAALQRWVLRPLSLNDTGVIADSRLPVEHMAEGYEPGPLPGQRRHSRFYAVEMRPGGGDLYGSLDDVHRFFAAIWRERFAGDSGDRILRDRQGDWASTGRSPGFYTAVQYMRKEDLLTVSLANNYAADFNWVESISARALGRDGFIDQIPELADKPWPAATHWEGRWHYENPGFSQHLEISHNPDNSLSIHDVSSQTWTALLPLKNGAYLETLYYGICRLEKGEHRTIQCTRFYPEGFHANLLPGSKNSH